jgi:hypothetical protein
VALPSNFAGAPPSPLCGTHHSLSARESTFARDLASVSARATPSRFAWIPVSLLFGLLLTVLLAIPFAFSKDPIFSPWASCFFIAGENHGFRRGSFLLSRQSWSIFCWSCCSRSCYLLGMVWESWMILQHCFWSMLCGFHWSSVVALHALLAFALRGAACFPSLWSSRVYHSLTNLLFSWGSSFALRWASSGALCVGSARLFNCPHPASFAGGPSRFSGAAPPLCERAFDSRVPLRIAGVKLPRSCEGLLRHAPLGRHLSGLQLLRLSFSLKVPFSGLVFAGEPALLLTSADLSVSTGLAIP